MPALRPIRLAAIAGAISTAACADTVAPGIPVESVRITTAQRALTENDTLTFTARALSAAGSPIDGRAALWTSSDSLVVSITPAGLATARTAGTATLRATAGGREAAAQVVVTHAQVGDLVLAPAALTLVQYEQKEVAAVARDTAGRPITGRIASWRSLDTTVAKVDAMGRVTARGVGTTAVTATIDGVTRAVPVAVGSTAVASVTAGPAPVLDVVGKYAQLIAIVRDTAGRSLLGYPKVWSSDAPRVATVNQFGVVAAVGPGTATISVVAGSKSFSITVIVANGAADAMPADLVYHRVAPGADGEIVIAGSTSGAAPVHVPLPFAASHATPSPDGSRIAFTRAGSGDIYVVDRNGDNLVRLTDDAAMEEQPAWSPDGQRIAYRRMSLGRSTIQLMQADGTGKVTLTSSIADTLDVANPAWSPDGTRIAFAAIDGSGTTPTGALWSMKADGTDRIRHLVLHAAHIEPSWSPDGQRVALSASTGDGGDIAILTIATGALEYLTLPGAQSSPVWSPNGEHLAFWQPIGGDGTAIYTVRKDGSNMRLHTTDPTAGSGYHPRWIAR